MLFFRRSNDSIDELFQRRRSRRHRKQRRRNRNQILYVFLSSIIVKKVKDLCSKTNKQFSVAIKIIKHLIILTMYYSRSHLLKWAKVIIITAEIYTLTFINGTLKYDHIKRLVTPTSDYIKQHLLYLAGLHNTADARSLRPLSASQQRFD